MPAPTGTVQSYQRLARRNRTVGLLRFVVPLTGALVLGGLIGQIYLASTGGRFGIDQVSITPDAVSIAAPEYVGTLADGSTYRVWAQSALATTEQSNLIDLSQAVLVIDRIDGVQLTMEAADAQLDTSRQLTLVPGLATFFDTDGTSGSLENAVFDWHSQLLTGQGPVAIDYADGSGVRAEGLVYDADKVIWTFDRSVVTVPETPGEAATGTSGDQSQ